MEPPPLGKILAIPRRQREPPRDAGRELFLDEVPLEWVIGCRRGEPPTLLERSRYVLKLRSCDVVTVTRHRDADNRKILFRNLQYLTHQVISLFCGRRLPKLRIELHLFLRPFGGASRLFPASCCCTKPASGKPKLIQRLLENNDEALE